MDDPVPSGTDTAAASDVADTPSNGLCDSEGAGAEAESGAGAGAGADAGASSPATPVADSVVERVVEDVFGDRNPDDIGYHNSGATATTETPAAPDRPFHASLVYGEVLALPMLKLLRFACDAVKPAVLARPGPPPRPLPVRRGGVFVDLGSGEGKALVVAAASGLFSRVVGIELVEGRHTEAVARCGRFAELRPAAAPIACLQGDILALVEEWKDADVVFAHSTCFTPELFAAMCGAAEGMKRGAALVTVSLECRSPLFDLVEEQAFELDWGSGGVYVYRRSTKGKWLSKVLRT